MGIPGGWELILVVVVIMVLFGYKKLPDATRSLGRSMRIFKAETKGLRDEGDAKGADTPAGTDRTGTGAPTVTAQPLPPAPVEPPPTSADAEQVQHRQP